MSVKIGTTQLEAGGIVFTTPPVGDDFGIPLVKPAKHASVGVRREVRNHCRVGGGTVVWFTDGTKTPPIHGRTAWWPA